jgi:hypothetical protein
MRELTAVRRNIIAVVPGVYSIFDKGYSPTPPELRFAPGISPE